MQKIGIIGCGWLGYRLANYLSDSFEIYTTTTTESKVTKLNAEGFNAILIDFDHPASGGKAAPATWPQATELTSINITVPLFKKSLNPEYLTTRINNLLSFIAGFEGQINFMSSIGQYKSVSGTISEDSLSVSQCPGEREIREKFPQANILRLGGLMGDNRYLSKYQVSDLNSFVNHVHYLDICRIIEAMTDRKLASKLYNIVAPMHPSKAEVLCMQKNTPYVPGTDIHGRIVLSSRLVEELEFTFRYPDPRLFPFNESFD